MAPTPEDTERETRGPFAWMVRHRIAPNLLMIVLIVGGLLMTQQIKQEVFPEFSLDIVTVNVAYPGASPEEVENSVVVAIEEAVRGLAGVKEVQSTANEGSGNVSIELQAGANRQEMFQKIQQAVSRIRTLPDDAEEPQVSLQAQQRDVMDILIYGDVDEQTMRAAAEFTRDQLLQDEGVTQVSIQGARRVEIHIDIPQQQLRAHNLTLPEVAQTIRSSALDTAGGTVETDSGDILLRVQERRNLAREFGNIPIIAGPAGSVVRVRDLGEVSQGFADSDVQATYNGKPAMGIEVFRVGEQTPIGVSDAVRTRLPEIVSSLPPSIDYVIEEDNSRIYSQRMGLLLQNGFIGLCLVLLLLSIFLEFKLAFWVTVGIPTAFLGTFLFLPFMDVSINIVSLFAFIIALGLVVDDAIIAGENIYEYRQRGMGNIKAAILGAKDIAVPISFAVLTNIIAFMPLAFVPGTFGNIFGVIPFVAGTAFALSWIEALLILPGHLGHTQQGGTGTHVGARLHRLQQRFSEAFSKFIETVYAPFLAGAMRMRYVTVAALIGVLAVVMAVPMSNRMGFILMPEIQGNTANATAVLPVGTPVERAEEVRDRLVESAQQVISNNGGDALSEGVYALIRENEIDVRAFLTDPNTRPLTTGEFSQAWRRATGEIAGLEALSFAADFGGPGGGPALSVELSHADIDTLERAASDLAQRLTAFSSVEDIDDGYTEGKTQLDFKLREEARSLGLTANEIGRQVRAAFYGAEALRQQIGRNEVRVLVRLPEAQRNSMSDVESLLLRTPQGGYVPLYQVADVQRGTAYTSINRRNGRRTTTVTADVVPPSETSRILSALRQDILPQMVRDYPGLSHNFRGRQQSMQEAIDSFTVSVTIALMAIYILLAIPLRSYAQPLVVMISIPFGVVGAILGHMIMGYNLSIVSIMGVIALGGVVVNGSLVMVHYANARRQEGVEMFDAMFAAGVRRFRPIMLTTLTTFGGLAPMIFETSMQARFMVPMALSLGYGILFASAILLLLIPCLYMIVEDIKSSLARLMGLAPRRAAGQGESGQAPAE